MRLMLLFEKIFVFNAVIDQFKHVERLQIRMVSQFRHFLASSTFASVVSCLLTLATTRTVLICGSAVRHIVECFASFW